MCVIIERTQIVVTVLLVIVVLAAGCVPLPPPPAPEPTATVEVPTPALPPPPPPPPTAVPGLAPEQLMNGVYLSEFVPDGKVTLTAGKFETSTGPAPMQKITVVLMEPMASGDLDGDGMADAAVILSTNTGGTGAFRDLHAVLNRDGQPVHAAAIPLGDRVQIKTLTIQHGAIVVDMLTHGPKDGLCCPTMAVVHTYRLEGNSLVLRPVAQRPTIRLAATVPVSPTLAVSPAITITPTAIITPTIVITPTRSITPTVAITPTIVITPTRSITPTILITSPREGETVASGAVVSGTVAPTPAGQTVGYQVVAGSSGQVIGSGTLPVKGEVGQKGTFAAPIQFRRGQEQAGRLEVMVLDPATGKPLARAVVNVRLADK